MSRTAKMILARGFGEFKNISQLYRTEKELINLGYIFTTVNSKFKLAIYITK